MTTQEAWKDIPESMGWYRVSNLGRIVSVERLVDNGRGGESRISERILANAPSGRYLTVKLSMPDGLKTFSVHRLVAEAFIGPIPDDREVCHYDNDGTNNDISNLRIDTRAGNFADKRRHGTHHFGETVNGSKLTESGIMRVVLPMLRAGHTRQRIADVCGVGPANISLIASGHRWSYLTGITP